MMLLHCILCDSNYKTIIMAYKANDFVKKSKNIQQASVYLKNEPEPPKNP